MFITGKLYDRLKFLALVVLPALGALYFGLAQIWGIPSAEKVVGSITLLDAFLGAVLQMSSATYNEYEVGGGSMVLVANPKDTTGVSAVLELDPDTAGQLEKKSEVRLKVRDETGRTPEKGRSRRKHSV